MGTKKIKDRVKKEFDKIYKNDILSLFEKYGFKRHTKTSKRIFKELGNQLSIFIIFDYISFGYGYYTFEIVYFDSEIGDVYDDFYLCMAKKSKPKISLENIEELKSSTDLWLNKMKTDFIPFIEKYSTHNAILKDSDNFQFPQSREENCKILLKRKS